jgi:hypothetical protein
MKGAGHVNERRCHTSAVLLRMPAPGGFQWVGFGMGVSLIGSTQRASSLAVAGRQSLCPQKRFAHERSVGRAGDAPDKIIATNYFNDNPALGVVM